jgi:hypothetical protein
MYLSSRSKKKQTSGKKEFLELLTLDRSFQFKSSSVPNLTSNLFFNRRSFIIQPQTSFDRNSKINSLDKNLLVLIRFHSKPEPKNIFGSIWFANDKILDPTHFIDGGNFPIKTSQNFIFIGKQVFVVELEFYK